jgi:hypothetical protein
LDAQPVLVEPRTEVPEMVHLELRAVSVEEETHPHGEEVELFHRESVVTVDALVRERRAADTTSA